MIRDDTQASSYNGSSLPGNRRRARLGVVGALAFVLFVAVGCGDTTGTGSTSTSGDPLAQQQYGGSYAGGTATGDTQAGAQFAQRVLQQDPNHQYITDVGVSN